MNSSRAEAEAIVAAYPAGSDVAVHYNPAKPSVAVLRPGAAGSVWLLFALGLFFVVLSSFVGGMFYLGSRSLEKLQLDTPASSSPETPASQPTAEPEAAAAVATDPP